MTILSKSSNNGYSYVDGTDEKLTVNATSSWTNSGRRC